LSINDGGRSGSNAKTVPAASSVKNWKKKGI